MQSLWYADMMVVTVKAEPLRIGKESNPTNTNTHTDGPGILQHIDWKCHLCFRYATSLLDTFEMTIQKLKAGLLQNIHVPNQTSQKGF